MSEDRRLQEAWFRAQGLAETPDDRIHPDDDMGRADVLRTEPERRRSVYMRSGHEACLVLKNALRWAGRDLRDTPSCLDFASGYGRLTRFLALEVPPTRIWASDVLDSALDFVRATFGVQGFRSEMDPVQLAFPRRFSLIWVGSLFSHLPRHRFGPFLSALHGALEDDGIAFFSTHSPEILAPAERDPSGFTFRAESESQRIDPREYGATFVEPSMVFDICRELGIEHLRALERELWTIQDLYAMSPRPIGGLAGWKHAPLVRGSIVRAEVGRDGHAWVGGIARVPTGEAPAREVSLLVDGERVIETRTAPRTEPLPVAEGGARFRQTDWYVEGPAGDLSPGPHTLCAVGRTRGGAANCFDARTLRVPRG